MDHLPLPLNPVFEKIEIPYLCSGRYDGDDFGSYPNRAGWEIKRGPGQISFIFRGKNVTEQQIGDLLQTWLFFGLLESAIKEPIDHTQFRTRSKHGNFIINSSSLDDIISQWTEKVISQHWSLYEESLLLWKDQIYSSIINTRDIVLRVVHSQTDPNSTLSLICLSIAILGEHLLQALKDIYLKRGLTSPIAQNWRVIGFADSARPILNMMQKRGWCPNKLGALNNQESKSVIQLWFYANLEPPGSTKDHGECKPEACLHLMVDQHNYQVMHRYNDCDCEMEGPVFQELSEVVMQNQLPLITADSMDSGGIAVQVQPYRNSCEFVAISHVWADGHGNVSSNTLPKCTLEQFQEFVNHLPRQADLINTPFWIDTICVPRYPLDLRKKALERLKEPYLLAQHVLIIDSYLQSLEVASLTPIEVLARVSMSGWTQRLWTFQEGRLAKRAWFQFRDKSVELYQIIDQWRDSFYRIPSKGSHVLDLSIIGSYNSSKILPDDQIEDRMQHIPALRMALANRATSDTNDEALCLGSILDLDLTAILRAEKSEGMQVFWSLVPRIPVGLAFSTSDQKIQTRGYRWAPKSLMGELETKLWGGPGGHFANLSAKPSPDGLVVKLPAFLFDAIADKSSGYSRSKKELLKAFNSRTWTKQSDSILFCDTTGNWYTCYLLQNWHQQPLEIEENMENPAILLAYSLDFNRINSDINEFQNQWSEDGIMITYNDSSTHINNESIINAKAHRHVLIQKVSKKDQFYMQGIKACFDQFFEQKSIAIREMVNAGTDGAQLVEVMREFARQYLDDNPDLLQLGQEILHYHDMEPSKMAVLNEVVRYVGQLCQLEPWYTLKATSNPPNWCID